MGHTAGGKILQKGTKRGRKGTKMEQVGNQDVHFYITYDNVYVVSFKRVVIM